MDEPLVSVLLLTYQQEQFVEQALASFLAQDWLNIEILVLDDASTDQTLEVVGRLLNQHPRRGVVQVIPSDRNRGLATNWNRGVALAKGEFIIAAAGDDITHATRVRISAEFLSENPSVHSLYYNCRIIDGAGQVQHDAWRKQSQLELRTLGPKPLWKGFPFNGATAAYRTQTQRLFGPIDPRCGTEDVSALMRAQLAGSAAASPLVAVDWRWHGANLSHGGVTFGVNRLKRLRAKLRKARGAIYDGRQLQKDAETAVQIGLRTTAEVIGIQVGGRKMELLNRLKYHALHPCSRWGVVGQLSADVVRSRAIPKTEAFLALINAWLRRLVPAPLRHWAS